MESGLDKMPKVVVYSCVTDSYDLVERTLLASRPKVDCNAKFVLFTDNEVKSHNLIWQIKPLLTTKSNPRKTARWHKINSHVVVPEADICLWVDGTQIFKEFRLWRDLIEPYLVEDLAAFNHPDRNCIYDEFQACNQLKKDHTAIMQQQMDKYRDLGYPRNNGLVETACVLRRHNEKIKAFNEAWWKEVDNHSVRDQLSFNFVAETQKLPYSHIPGRGTHSPFFMYIRHRKPYSQC